ncbi:MAG: hypothetical protein GY749_12305 [Desulfobacteraceae bacterium]|nr:hypothetical protein [Desulfobacteraceae bacterium]
MFIFDDVSVCAFHVLRHRILLNHTVLADQIIKLSVKFSKRSALINTLQHDFTCYRHDLQNRATFGDIKIDGIHNTSVAVDKIISANSLLWKSYPRLLCSKCFSGTEKKKIKTGLAVTAHTIIACRHCGGTGYLIKNISQVIGLIGSDIEKFCVKDDNAFVSLWSEQQKKARNADIHILEIRNSEGISYDYAINSVLVTLKNDVSRPPGYVKRIPVKIHGNPPIPEGAMLILEHEFREIIKKE